MSNAVKTDPPPSGTDLKNEEVEYIGIRKASLGIPDNINKDYLDPVVASLEQENRPQPEVVCQYCPGACFFTTHNTLNCFCKHMNTLSWGNGLPPITRCTAQSLFVTQWKSMLAETA